MQRFTFFLQVNVSEFSAKHSGHLNLHSFNKYYFSLVILESRNTYFYGGTTFVSDFKTSSYFVRDEKVRS